MYNKDMHRLKVFVTIYYVSIFIVVVIVLISRKIYLALCTITMISCALERKKSEKFVINIQNQP